MAKEQPGSGFNPEESFFGKLSSNVSRPFLSAARAVRGSWLLNRSALPLLVGENGTFDIHNTALGTEAFQDTWRRIAGELTSHEDPVEVQLRRLYLVTMPRFLYEQGFLGVEGREVVSLLATLSQEDFDNLAGGASMNTVFKRGGFSSLRRVARNPVSMTQVGAANFTPAQRLYLYTTELGALAGELGVGRGEDAAEKLMKQLDEKATVEESLSQQDPELAEALRELPARMFTRLFFGTLYAAFVTHQMGKDLQYVIPPHVKIDFSGTR